MRTSIRSTASFLALAALVGTSTVGCAGMQQRERGAVVGAGTGAAIGGVIGHRTGNTTRGAILGAVIGGAAGAVIGAQMDRQARTLEAELEGAQVSRVGEGIAVTFESGILFPFDSEQVLPAGRTNLQRLATTLQRYPGSEVLIVGHTDNVGSAAYNQRLSERRAEAAAQILVANGISRARIQTAGRAFHEPIASNETDAGRQQNRRVEIAIFASEQYRQQILREHGQ
jgi:outer membrane protein OmpA-like peptidoglycan-associated protein